MTLDERTADFRGRVTLSASLGSTFAERASIRAEGLALIEACLVERRSDIAAVLTPQLRYIGFMPPQILDRLSTLALDADPSTVGSVLLARLVLRAVEDGKGSAILDMGQKSAIREYFSKLNPRDIAWTLLPAEGSSRRWLQEVE